MKNFKKNGFTIVELVIVIAVIGILSAVLIPTFSGLVSKANDTATQESLRNAYTEYASNYTYSAATPTLYSREEVCFTTQEMSNEDGVYTILESTDSSPVYCPTSNGKYEKCNSTFTTSVYLGQFNEYFAYAVV